MTLHFDQLPGWHFEVREESAGVYTFTGFRDGAQRLQMTGPDTTALVERCRREAMEMENGPGGNPAREVG